MCVRSRLFIFHCDSLFPSARGRKLVFTAFLHWYFNFRGRHCKRIKNLSSPGKDLKFLKNLKSYVVETVHIKMLSAISYQPKYLSVPSLRTELTYSLRAWIGLTEPETFLGKRLSQKSHSWIFFSWICNCSHLALSYFSPALAICCFSQMFIWLCFA